MLNIRKPLFMVFILMVLAVPMNVGAQHSTQPVDTFYIVPSQAALSHVIQPPPSAGSQALKDDLKAVQTAHENRTEAQVKSAQADNALTIFDFVSDVLGPNFSKEKLKITSTFYRSCVIADQIEACLEVKEHFNRQRPFVLDPEIKPVVPATGECLLSQRPRNNRLCIHYHPVDDGAREDPGTIRSGSGLWAQSRHCRCAFPYRRRGRQDLGSCDREYADTATAFYARSRTG